jgi:hypothetical protein
MNHQHNIAQNEKLLKETNKPKNKKQKTDLRWVQE